MAKIKKSKLNKRVIRHKRIRARITGTAKRPRLSVFRSNKHIFMQLIDDIKGKTLVSVSDLELKSKIKDKKSKTQTKNKKTDIASQVGQLLAKKALDKKIKTVVFDRGGFKYHGRIKASAESAREEGLYF